MDDIREHVRYGFRLWPFAVLVMLGVLVNSIGPGFYQSLMSGMSGIPLYNILLIAGILVLQFAGGVIAAAGFFGALRKILQDSQ